MSKMKKITGKALFLPIFCMLLVMLVNVIYDAASGNFAFSFFSISVRNGVLYGRLIDILNRGFDLLVGIILNISQTGCNAVKECCKVLGTSDKLLTCIHISGIVL